MAQSAERCSFFRLDLRGQQSGCPAMTEAHILVEDATINALQERIEAALELASAADAVDQLEAIERLCGDAQALARAGRILIGVEAARVDASA